MTCIIFPLTLSAKCFMSKNRKVCLELFIMFCIFYAHPLKIKMHFKITSLCMHIYLYSRQQNYSNTSRGWLTYQVTGGTKLTWGPLIYLPKLGDVLGERKKVDSTNSIEKTYKAFLVLSVTFYVYKYYKNYNAERFF